MDCAREMRGSSSSAKLVILRSRIALMASSALYGCRRPRTTVPSRICGDLGRRRRVDLQDDVGGERRRRPRRPAWPPRTPRRGCDSAGRRCAAPAPRRPAPRTSRPRPGPRPRASHRSPSPGPRQCGLPSNPPRASGPVAGPTGHFPRAGDEKPRGRSGNGRRPERARRRARRRAGVRQACGAPPR